MWYDDVMRGWLIGSMLFKAVMTSRSLLASTRTCGDGKCERGAFSWAGNKAMYGSPCLSATGEFIGVTHSTLVDLQHEHDSME
jgi:hypothetical protein